MARVLVVEDSPTIVSHVESVLREDGHEVYVARSDILLPHSNGFDICKTIRRNAAYQPMKVVMMTSLVDEESVRKAYEVGANGYIKKPFTNRDLHQELANQLNKDKKNSVPGVSGIAF